MKLFALVAAAVIVGVVTPATAGPGDGAVDVLVVKDVDFDGVYTPGVDKPQGDIPITLTDAAGRSLSTETDSLGHTGFAPAFADLAGGRYRLEARRPDPPLVYIRPAAVNGAEWVAFVDVRGGHDAHVVLGVVDPDDLPPGTPNPVLIGGRVWLDERPDGVQQPDEDPAVGVRCELRSGYREAVAVTTTDDQGQYAFAVPADTAYHVVCNPPAGLTPTVKRAGTSRTIDSDADQDGSIAVRGHRKADNDATYDLGLVPAVAG
ncbi:MAG: hypothetical protein HOU81_19940 [Hamadaea sp.]|uniref:SdrD B-like domain-containing protein n=1 Tax=Hamadaea sp. TaxID=2024425 RepID=UPI001833D2E2|nr:SdrD B-like domain-containing protein [Hamadaea sp.]NUR73094.1 hypothetical protein [Hamadaea sp.]NUT23006.1 hypothetical protein [Hamadaea sp.]